MNFSCSSPRSLFYRFCSQRVSWEISHRHHCQFCQQEHNSWGQGGRDQWRSFYFQPEILPGAEGGDRWVLDKCRSKRISQHPSLALSLPLGALCWVKMLLSLGIDLENIVYYRDNTHYFVMTAKKPSLLDKGVIISVSLQSWLASMSRLSLSCLAPFGDIFFLQAYLRMFLGEVLQSVLR